MNRLQTFVWFCSFAIFIAEAMNTDPMTCEDKKLIVDRHNELRKRVAEGKLNGQPKASNMNRLVWDDKLQAVAEKWVSEVSQIHDHNGPDGPMGENTFYAHDKKPNTKANWTAVVYDWYSENVMFTYSNSYSLITAGYSQVAWADTMYVGCAHSEFVAENTIFGNHVCAYRPTGNVQGQYLYKTGPGCEQLCCSTQCNDKLYGDQC